MQRDTLYSLDYFVHRNVDTSWAINTREIENHELVVVTNGQLEITINKKTFIASKNSIIYFAPNVPHSLKCIEPCSFYGMHFSFDQNKKRLELFNIMELQKHSKIKNLFIELNIIHKQKEYLYQWQENIILNQILLELHLEIHKDNSPKDIKNVSKAIEFIHKAPYNQISIEELCLKAGLKKSRFLQIFKQITSTSPLQYCITLKLEYAKDLLLGQPNISIGDVAHSCGFEDEFYFSRLFKNHIGCSPKAFREKGDIN